MLDIVKSPPPQQLTVSNRPNEQYKHAQQLESDLAGG
jgi:hypothetical protein